MSHTDSKQLSIILVNYNSNDWLEKCLSSFKNLRNFFPNPEKSLYETIIVDNGSTKSTTDLQQHFPWVKWVRLEKNLGFSGGNNVGIQHATGKYIMLLNTDTEIPQNADLLKLLENFEHDPQIGVVSPRVNFPSGELDHASHRGFPTPWNSLMYYSGIAKVLPWFPIVAGYRLSWKNMQQAHEIDACTGAAMIVRRAAMDQVGLLDESFFMYAEDIDWCYRFQQAGWKIWFDPSQIIIHHKHKSGLGQSQSWETKVRTTNAFFDTMKQFWRKHYQTRYPRFLMSLGFVMIDLMKYWKLQKERKHHADA